MMDRAWSILVAHGVRKCNDWEKTGNYRFSGDEAKYHFDLYGQQDITPETVVHSALGIPYPTLERLFAFLLRWGRVSTGFHQIVYAMNLSEDWGHQNLNLSGSINRCIEPRILLQKQVMWHEVCESTPAHLRAETPYEKFRQAVWAQVETEKTRLPPPICTSCSFARRELRKEQKMARKASKKRSGSPDEGCCVVQ